VTRRRFPLPGRVPVTKARTCPRTPNGTGGTTIIVKEAGLITDPDTALNITRLIRPRFLTPLYPPVFSSFFLLDRSFGLFYNPPSRRIFLPSRQAPRGTGEALRGEAPRLRPTGPSSGELVKLFSHQTPMPGTGTPKHENNWLAKRSSFRRKPESRNVQAVWIPDRVRDDNEKQILESDDQFYFRTKFFGILTFPRNLKRIGVNKGTNINRTSVGRLKSRRV
jgi:hypothetical protein